MDRQSTPVAYGRPGNCTYVKASTLTNHTYEMQPGDKRVLVDADCDCTIRLPAPSGSYSDPYIIVIDCIKGNHTVQVGTTGCKTDIIGTLCQTYQCMAVVSFYYGWIILPDNCIM